MNRTQRFFFLILCAIFFVLPFVTLAQTPPCPPGCIDLIVPIDGGIGFLIVAGAAYGVKKVASRSRK